MNKIHIVAVAAAVLLFASAAAAEVQTREIEYKEGEAVLQGLIAWDDASKGPRPGVLVVHEWWGSKKRGRESLFNASSARAASQRLRWQHLQPFQLTLPLPKRSLFPFQKAPI